MANLQQANRKLEPIRNEFLKRYYSWARNDARREYVQGFPFLGRIRSSQAFRFMEYLEQLKEDQKLEAMLAMVKRFHTKGAALCGDSIEPHEEEFIGRYLAWRQERIPGLRVPVWNPCSKAEAKLRELEKSGSIRLTVDDRELRKLLVDSLSQVLGNSDQGWKDRGTWRHSLEIAGWQVFTYFDVGGQARQLGYDHTICVMEHVNLLERASILSWLGISSQTDWDLIADSQLQETASCVSQVCKHFMTGLTGLLVELPKPEL